jgi:hypothetical protein
MDCLLIDDENEAVKKWIEIETIMDYIQDLLEDLKHDWELSRIYFPGY